MPGNKVIPSTEVSSVEAARIKAMGFDKQPERVITDADRSLIQSVLEDRMGEYFRDLGHGWRLNTLGLARVVGDIVSASLRRDRERREEVPDGAA